MSIGIGAYYCLFLSLPTSHFHRSSGGSTAKNPPAMQEPQEMRVHIPGSGRSPGGGNGNPLHILAWEIPWTEKPGRLQPVGVTELDGHDRARMHAP